MNIKQILLIRLDVQFTYEDPLPPASPKSPKYNTRSKTNVRSPRTRRLGSDRDEQAWTDDESAPSSELYIGQYHYNHQHGQHQSDHRASIASAPATAMRSGSITTTTGVC